MQALALRKAAANVVGIVGLVENMPDGLDSSLRDHAGVHAVEVRAPNLEEIFVAYMERPEKGFSGTGKEEVTP